MGCTRELRNKSICHTKDRKQRGSNEVVRGEPTEEPKTGSCETGECTILNNKTKILSKGGCTTMINKEDARSRRVIGINVSKRGITITTEDGFHTPVKTNTKTYKYMRHSKKEWV